MRTPRMRRAKAPRLRPRKMPASGQAVDPESSRPTKVQPMRKVRAPRARRKKTPDSAQPSPNRLDQFGSTGPAEAGPDFCMFDRATSTLAGGAQALEQWRADQHVG